MFSHASSPSCQYLVQDAKLRNGMARDMETYHSKCRDLIKPSLDDFLRDFAYNKAILEGYIKSYLIPDQHSFFPNTGRKYAEDLKKNVAEARDIADLILVLKGVIKRRDEHQALINFLYDKINEKFFTSTTAQLNKTDRIEFLRILIEEAEKRLVLELFLKQAEELKLLVRKQVGLSGSIIETDQIKFEQALHSLITNIENKALGQQIKLKSIQAFADSVSQLPSIKKLRSDKAGSNTLFMVVLTAISVVTFSTMGALMLGVGPGLASGGIAAIPGAAVGASIGGVIGYGVAIKLGKFLGLKIPPVLKLSSLYGFEKKDEISKFIANAKNVVRASSVSETISPLQHRLSISRGYS